MTIESLPVYINGEGQYYAAGYFSVSSDNIILYRYVCCVLYRYIMLLLDQCLLFCMYLRMMSRMVNVSLSSSTKGTAMPT
jgi:hypothetical protein